MKFALKSFTPEPVSMRYKVDTLSHELLHIFLNQNPIKNSVLLKKHATEDERVRDHLHLIVPPEGARRAMRLCQCTLRGEVEGRS